MWWWVLILGLLLVWAGAYLGVRAWGLWGQLKGFGRELADAQRRLDEVQGQVDLLGERGSPDDLAVFADRTAIRARRDKERAAALASRKRRRRAQPRPTWAKHVD